MEGKNPPQTESSLLFRLPNSMMSLSDMSANPVLMPVAVQNVEDTQRSLPTSTNSSEQSEPNDSESTSLCQLEQPLLMRRPSSSSVQTTTSQVYSQLPSSASNIIVPETSQYHWVGSNNEGLSNTASVSETSARYPTLDPTIHSAASRFVGQTHVLTPSTSCHMTPTTHGTSTSFYASAKNVPASLPTVDYSFSFHDTTCLPNISSDSASFYAAGREGASAFNDSMAYSNIVADSYPSANNDIYLPIKPHWLFQEVIETKEIWKAFSEVDSARLEEAFVTGIENVVPSDGGRYDVYIDLRVKKSVFFDTKDLIVRRATWFSYDTDSVRGNPYPEDVSEKLEQFYCNCVTSGQWQKRFPISGIGVFLFENSATMHHYINEVETWPAIADVKSISKIVKRGLPLGFAMMPNESPKIDHLVFIVQGIGSFCDLRFRTVSQCVDGFRDIANKLIESHFKSEVEQGCVGRVEFLPVAWHSKLHTSEVGLDQRMKTITLPSIPKLRHFTNDTLIDILLYSSPSYCQSIIDTVAHELNKLHGIFLSRNPTFAGRVSVAGHSLGSLILFDILANQNSSEVSSDDSFNYEPTNSTVEHSECSEAKTCPAPINNFLSIEALLESLDMQDYIDTFKAEKVDLDSLKLLSESSLKDMGISLGPRTKLLAVITPGVDVLKSSSVCSDDTRLKKRLSLADPSIQGPMIYPAKSVKSGMSLIIYPRLEFKPACFFALGSPISMFLAVRGYDSISEDFEFPTCTSFFHIFHPYDPVAFRIETLIDPNFSAKPELIPHHKGRKRMHLEIKENVSKIASEIKQKLMDTMRYTWNSLSEFAKNHAFTKAILEAEVDKIVEHEMSGPVEGQEISSEDITIGRLNNGRRIDYVLQEKPIEALNDYVFALTSHATYWDSEDTVLMILREIYALQGIVMSPQQTDCKSVIHSRETSSHCLSMDSANTMDVSRSCSFPQPVYTSAENFPSIPAASFPVGAEENTFIPTVTYSQQLPAASTSRFSDLPSISPLSPSVDPPTVVPRSQTMGIPPAVLAAYQSFGIPPIGSASQGIGTPHVASTSQHVSSPPLASTSQPIGPPPLSGFVKRSAFQR